MTLRDGLVLSPLKQGGGTREKGKGKHNTRANTGSTAEMPTTPMTKPTNNSNCINNDNNNNYTSTLVLMGDDKANLPAATHLQLNSNVLRGSPTSTSEEEQLRLQISVAPRCLLSEHGQATRLLTHCCTSPHLNGRSIPVPKCAHQNYPVPHLQHQIVRRLRTWSP